MHIFLPFLLQNMLCMPAKSYLSLTKYAVYAGKVIPFSYKICCVCRQSHTFLLQNMLCMPAKSYLSLTKYAVYAGKVIPFSYKICCVCRQSHTFLLQNMLCMPAKSYLCVSVFIQLLTQEELFINQSLKLNNESIFNFLRTQLLH